LYGGFFYLEIKEKPLELPAASIIKSRGGLKSEAKVACRENHSKPSILCFAGWLASFVLFPRIGVGDEFRGRYQTARIQARGVA
jgi:hypothetical protein